MSVATTAVHTHAKIGTCPHGLPPGACPICNGMAGGNSTTKRDIPRNVGELTYNQCAAIGAMLRAQKNAKEQAKISEQNYLQAIANFQKAVSNIQQRFIEFSAFINKNMPTIIAKPINFILNNVVLKTLNVIKNLPNIINNFVQNIAQKFADISEKLTAIYGELKAALSKNISEVFKDTKKKLKSIFFIFGTDETDDDEKKIEEAKKIFNLKTLLHKLTNKLQGKKDSDDQER